MARLSQKAARSAMIRKEKGDRELPHAYRLLCRLCLIKCLGKCSKSSTGVNALMRSVLQETYPQGNSGSVLLIALDVRKAFNSIRWADKLGTLENSFYVQTISCSAL